MFEYFNTGAFLLIFLLSLPMLFYRDRFLLFLFGVIYLLMFSSAYDSYSDAKSNMKYFLDNKTLICFSGGGLYNSATRYSVSKEEGWELQKNYFKKESLLIRADKCEE